MGTHPSVKALRALRLLLPEAPPPHRGSRPWRRAVLVLAPEGRPDAAASLYLPSIPAAGGKSEVLGREDLGTCFRLPDSTSSLTYPFQG